MSRRVEWAQYMSNLRHDDDITDFDVWLSHVARYRYMSLVEPIHVSDNQKPNKPITRKYTTNTMQVPNETVCYPECDYCTGNHEILNCSEFK